mmetsp:Transcript_91940/g.297412  ORF Transcript_91940/g.297412 Transcript_91940/m.297412 type:complete len:552 (-) Transcript_91940:39-1694(-)
MAASNSPACRSLPVPPLALVPRMSPSRGPCRAAGSRWAPAVHSRLALLVPLVLSLPGAAAGKASQSFHPNCAAKKQCNRPLEERDPMLHEVPSSLEGQVPKGHLKPLGHADFADSWAGEVDVVEDMDPETFWTKYWPKKPFVLKGFAKRSPAFTKWKDDEYLLEHFGEFKAKCEPKNEDRLTDYCGQVKHGQKINCGKDIIPYTETHMRLKKFLPHYKDKDWDKYVITQMPDAMGSDYVLPNFHSCGKRDPDDPGPEGGGRWMTQMYENNFWLSFNDGNNFSTSVIHFDMNHQIMCQFDGKKEWIMWDMQSESKKIPMWSNYYKAKNHEAQGSDDSPIDGERVDLERWPGMKDAKWFNATLEAGDCLYTPAFLLHYVRSYGRNVAGMSMFQREERFDPKCNGEAVGEPQTLDKYDVLWSFPEEDKSLLGWNLVKMGFPNWKRSMLWPLVKRARKHKDKKLRKKEFVQHMKGLVQREGLKKAGARINAAWKAMDEDGDGLVEAWRLFRSRELRFIFKDVAVQMEGGRGNQEEDVEVNRFDLQGSTEERKLEL